MTVHALPQVASMVLDPQPRMVIQLFRKLDVVRREDRTDHPHDLADLLAATLPLSMVDAIVSDAIMVDNELRLRATGTILFFPHDAPTASHDEAALLNLISAIQRGDYRRAAHAAVQLEILQSRMLLILAHRLAGKLAQAGVTLKGTFHGTVPSPPARLRQGTISRADFRVV
jgi:hypothetical protein